MKKFMAMAVAACCALLVFVGCGSSYKDGAYKAQYKDADEHGWTEFVEVTVKDGKVSDVTFDAKNADGKLKSQDAEYKSYMEATGTWPEKFYGDIAEQYKEKQSAEKMDAVAGATNSSDSFKVLMTELEKSMKEGNTDTITVEASK
ncbi:FMN-binding protein [Neobittarella massiliensis]|uniref:FMN-binding protein n=2 Tax=Oscillospiraceae TaxID=216572 RepID=A0A8J6LVF2_9FIRM|nr:FMN-binding protein [Neobittarella massiliensis]MBC3516330.1 FMN-binding protein [Neobittarella massiliensis]SCJ87292.1 Major membrane immunogen%2C membrane-anchored lipoprotein [uncultured Anaerotruncus sp.]